MQCPKCGFEQPDGSSDCLSCGIIFSKWEDRQTRQQLSPPEPPPPEESPIPPEAPPVYSQEPDQVSGPASSHSPLIDLVLLGILGLITWWIFFPRSGSVSETAFIDRANQFAIETPESWIQMTRQNFDELKNEYSEYIPENTRQFMNNESLAVAFIKIDKPGSFPPSVNIVLLNQDPPPINRKTLDLFTREVSSQLGQVFEGLNVDNQDIVKIDGLKSFRLDYSGSIDMIVVPPTYQSARDAWGNVNPFKRVLVDPGVTEKTNLRYIQALVPGKKRGYVVTLTSEASDFASNQSVFEEILDSFRVLQKPARFSLPVNAGLIAAIFSSALFLFRRLVTALGGG